MNWKNTSTLMLSALVLGSLIVLPGLASALDVPNCRIVKVGIDPNLDGAMVQLDDLSDTFWATPYRQFYLSPTLGNQGLAVLLTAYSLDQTVWVRIAGDGSAGSLITIIFINKSQ